MTGNGVNNNIRGLCYNLYKMDWMRRISADRQMDTYKTWYEEEYLPNCQQIMNAYTGEADTVYTGLSFEVWLMENNGYDGELYVSEFEFFEMDFWDKMQMEKLLGNDKLYEEYLKEVSA